MEYICTALMGLYGYPHGLQLCTSCFRTYCRCIETFATCCSCSATFCADCISSRKRLFPVGICSCLVCPRCFDLARYIEHGGRCRRFSGRFKTLIYPLTIVDAVDHISTFLFKGEIQTPPGASGSPPLDSHSTHPELPPS